MRSLLRFNCTAVGGHHKWCRTEPLIVGDWTVMFSIKIIVFDSDIFLTNLHTNLYHEEGSLFKKIVETRFCNLNLYVSKLQKIQCDIFTIYCLLQ